MAVKSESNLEVLVSPLFLLVCTLLTVGAITFLLYWLSGLAFGELPIKLQHTAPQEVTKHEQPVEVNLYINDFDKFNIIGEEFVINASLILEFDPHHVSLDQVSHFSFLHGQVLHRSDPIISKVNGRTRVQYDIHVKLEEDLDFSWFPFEDHRISIMLVDKTTATSVAFVTKKDPFDAPDMNFKGWHKFGAYAETGYVETQIKGEKTYYPAVVFSADYGRWTNTRNMLLILLPMLLLFFVALFSIIIDYHKNFIFVLTIPITAIVGLMSYRFVIENMSPKVGYFMFSDYFFLLFLLLIFVILIANALGRYLGSLSRKLIIVALNAIVVLTLYSMLHRMDVVFASRGFVLNADNTIQQPTHVTKE